MPLTIQNKQGVEEWCVSVRGRFDFSVARACLAEVGARAWHRNARLVFDLTDVERIESAGLGAMLLLLERMPGAHRPVVRCANREVWSVLHITHMEHYCDLEAEGELARQLSAQAATPAATQVNPAP
ncbi:MAG: STAS domain-containing protein [Pseudomonadota bacterium]